jgi:uncharacterized protein (DUF1501 family)
MKPDLHLPYISRRGFLQRFGTVALGTSVLSRTIRELRILNTAMAQGPSMGDYKALICVFLNGGNDSNNMIIPTLASEWDSYAAIRSAVLAIPNTDGGPATALAMSSKNGLPGFPASDGRTYGFHPAMPEIRALYDAGVVAPVFNVGTLSFPLTKAQYSAKSVPRPPQLFSHSDQQTQWQTSLPDQPYTSGWGGRLADMLTTPVNINNGGQCSLAVTLAGSNIFQVGDVNAAPQYSINSSGVVKLSSSIPAAGKTALESLLASQKVSPDLQTRSYAQVLDHSIDQAQLLSDALLTNASASWLSRFANPVVTPNGGSSFTSSLMNQMKMVARLIHLGSRPVNPNPLIKDGLGMRRQIFFIQVGGYDTHTNQTNNAGATATDNAKVIIGSHANLMAELSKSLNALYQAMNDIGTPAGLAEPLTDCVTAFTASDFSRTFPANGYGSDHGWGGHQLVMGGAVKGGATYGKFPTLAVNGPDDTGLGRWIPTTAVDQYAATLATWFGVDANQLDTVFPNLGRFPTPNLGFL